MPQIVKALDNETISVNAAFQCAKLILDEGLPELKVLKRVINSSVLIPIKKPKRFSRKKKEYMIYCPSCNQLILADRKVSLITLEEGRQRYVSKGEIFSNNRNVTKHKTT
jgi:hypothetical protein